uniref:ABC transporter domain-containing protein n=1 Tax=Ciona savignyi TaxID=51511 RepID=H2Z7L4_CIOSA
MTSNNEITLSFHNIRYEVRKKLDDVPLCGKTCMKEILLGVSGLLPPGLNAIMGPTGSGKTSLLDVLAQRKDPTGLKDGIVLLNGERPPIDFRLMSGYVVQDDVVMGTLTVRENLAFSANLRLSTKKHNAEARKLKVNDVIEQLGLQALSGGERKRVNIGMEMILDPPVLFLDEPTTGLDANTANSIVLLLYKLASGGRNIIMSIHQPRYSIFSLFDRLLLLNKGDIVYRGPAKQAVDHFKSIGFSCPRFHNPADFFLDIVGGDVNTARLIGRMNSESQDNEPAENAIEDKVKKMTAKRQSLLHTAFEESSGNVNYSLKNQVMETTHYANGFFHQLATVVRRTGLNILRNPMTSFVQIIIMIIFAVLIGLIYFQSDTSFKSGIQNRAGCFFFLVMTQVMSNLSALELFINNRAHFIHESASGYYRVSVYFIAQIIADLIPNRLIPNTFFSVIIYFMIGFQMQVEKFFFFLFALVLTAVCASSMAFLVSASVRVFAIANAVVALPYILMMLFGGFLVNIGTLLDWLEWVKYVSIFRYGINALTVNEMSGLVFIDNSWCVVFVKAFSFFSTTGEIYMEAQGIEYGVWGLWVNIVALGSMCFGFLFLAYIQMRRVNKFK